MSEIETIDDMVNYYEIVKKIVFDHYYTHKSREFLIQTLQKRKGEGWTTNLL